jgi:hypothetical protein
MMIGNREETTRKDTLNRISSVSADVIAGLEIAVLVMYDVSVDCTCGGVLLWEGNDGAPSFLVWTVTSMSTNRSQPVKTWSFLLPSSAEPSFPQASTHFPWASSPHPPVPEPPPH